MNNILSKLSKIRGNCKIWGMTVHDGIAIFLSNSSQNSGGAKGQPPLYLNLHLIGNIQHGDFSMTMSTQQS